MAINEREKIAFDALVSAAHYPKALAAVQTKRVSGEDVTLVCVLVNDDGSPYNGDDSSVTIHPIAELLTGDDIFDRYVDPATLVESNDDDGQSDKGT